MQHRQLPIGELLGKLRLNSSRHSWQNTAERARNEGWSHEEFLAVLLLQELNYQQVTHLHHLCQSAGFPFQKSIREFDFDRVSPQCKPVIEACLDREFVTDGRSLLITGEPGSGKTHLAVGIALQALQNGFDALYVRAEDLLVSLEQSIARGQWRESMALYTRPDVLILDDVSEEDLRENHLFLLLNERYIARRPVVLTARLPPEQWTHPPRGGLLVDLILERVLERGQILYLDSACCADPDPTVIELGTSDLTESFAPPISLPLIEAGEETKAKEQTTVIENVVTPPEPARPEDRRTHKRYSASIEVNVSSLHNFFTGFCKDISEGGLFLATHESQPVGSLIDLEFSLPSGHTVRTCGVVRWQRLGGEGKEWPGVGVEFLALSPEDLAAIHEFFNQRDPLFFA